jgi:type II secretory pathway component PulF
MEPCSCTKRQLGIERNSGSRIFDFGFAATNFAMALWRYIAVAHADGGSHQTGEMAGDSAAQVRASLRRIGLQVIDVEPIGARRFGLPTAIELGWLLEIVHRHLRSRRRLARSELCDSLATMLASGIPLLEAFDSLLESDRNRARSMRTMLLDVRERLRGGESLSESMRKHISWFETTEIAIVDAGQHSGRLAEVLQSLADRNQHADELGHKLTGALAYPLLVAIVGLGVTVFLSVKTLPDLTAILVQARIPVPGLTQKVMGVGQLLAHHWWLLGFLILAVPLLAIAARRILTRWPLWPSVADRLRMLQPKVVRAMAVGQFALQLAELLRSGVPMVDALRVLAPTTRSSSLRSVVMNAADRLERGDDLASALSDDRWFDSEFRRLAEIGQTSGELDSMLARLGERYQRQAKRLIDRLAALLEPCVILALAALVGTVVMAAVLPLLRLQAVVR